MTKYLRLLLIISFATSLIIGEELCCDGVFEDDASVSSQSIKTDDSQNQEALSTHFCQGHKKSDKSSHEENHHCIGCSHAPFVNLENLSKERTFLPSETLFLEKQIFISHHFLDGPFQPPKA